MSKKDAAAKPQSAVVPYRWRHGDLEVMLITSRTTRRWVLPKGDLEPELSPAESAAKEAWEEAGLTGPVAESPLGSYRYLKYDEHDGTYECALYPMEVAEVLEDWPEKDQRHRQWMPVKTAAKRVHEPRLRKLLLAFRKAMEE